MNGLVAVQHFFRAAATTTATTHPCVVNFVSSSEQNSKCEVLPLRILCINSIKKCKSQGKKQKERTLRVFSFLFENPEVAKRSRKFVKDEGSGFRRAFEFLARGSRVEHGCTKAQERKNVGTMVSFRLAAVFAALKVVSGERFNEIKVCGVRGRLGYR